MMKRFCAYILAGLICVTVNGTFCTAETKQKGNRPEPTASANLPDPVPQKIVSLSPAVTEILFAVGAENQIAARTDYCNWPTQTVEIPSVGGFDGKATSLEKILSFRPDLVCLTSGMHDHLIEPLKRYGIPVFVSSAQTFQAVLSEIMELARISGHEQQGMECIERIRNKIIQARTFSQGKNPVRVFWEVSAVPYFTCGSASFINDMLTYAGAQNIFNDIVQSYPQVSEESIIARAPDVIIVSEYGNTNTAETVYKRRAWQHIPAVVQKKVFAVDADIISRPGPRIGEAVLTIARLLYSEDDI